jgi:hypothetical protein
MYDSITCFLPGACIPTDRVQQDQRGHCYTKNLRIYQSLDGVVIKGSLPKFLHGENFTNLTRQEVREAISLVEIEVGLSLHGGNVWAIETGAMIAVNEPPSAYFAAWGQLPRYMKNVYGSETVTYFTRSRSFTGYDKQAETGLQCGIPPDQFAIRLELKIKRGMKGIHGRYLDPWELTEKEAYLRQVQLWSDYYFRIPKRRGVVINTNRITPKIYERGLATIGLNNLGADRTYSIIREGQKKGEINRITASRMRAFIRELEMDTRVSTVEANTVELDNKVRSIIELARVSG